MSTKILFWDKIYYRELQKKISLIDSNKNIEEWDEVKKNTEKYQNNPLVFLLISFIPRISKNL